MWNNILLKEIYTLISLDHRLYKLVIAKLPQISTTDANQESIEETTEDMSPGINVCTLSLFCFIF
jgi:hypothetical protein